MPASPFKLPCASLDDSRLVMVQAQVDTDDKRTIMMALGASSGIHALVIQSAYRNLATFIRTHGLNTYDSDPIRIARITDFIRDGTDTCAPREAVAHVKSGGGKGRQRKAS